MVREGVRLREAPVETAGLRIERIDCAAAAGEKDAASDYRWLAVVPSRVIKGPLHFEPGDFVAGKLRAGAGSASSVGRYSSRSSRLVGCGTFPDSGRAEGPCRGGDG